MIINRNIPKEDYKIIPVDIMTFIEDDYYLGYGKDAVWDYYKSLLTEIYPDSYTRNTEVLMLSGGSRAGTSTIIDIIWKYELYRLLCLKNVSQSIFGKNTGVATFNLIAHPLFTNLLEVFNRPIFKSLITYDNIEPGISLLNNSILINTWENNLTGKDVYLNLYDEITGKNKVQNITQAISRASASTRVKSLTLISAHPSFENNIFNEVKKYIKQTSLELLVRENLCRLDINGMDEKLVSHILTTRDNRTNEVSSRLVYVSNMWADWLETEGYSLEAVRRVTTEVLGISVLDEDGKVTVVSLYEPTKATRDNLEELQRVVETMEEFTALLHTKESTPKIVCEKYEECGKCTDVRENILCPKKDTSKVLSKPTIVYDEDNGRWVHVVDREILAINLATILSEHNGTCTCVNYIVKELNTYLSTTNFKASITYTGVEYWEGVECVRLTLIGPDIPEGVVFRTTVRELNY